MLNRKLNTWLASLLLLLGLSATAQAAPQIGQPAPDFELTDATGKTHKLSDYADKVVMLEWTNHECPFVRKHYNSGNMQKLQKDYTALGVVWLSVISSAPGKQGYVTPEQAQELTTSRNAAPTAVLFDPQGTTGIAYDARTTPHMYVIDKGILRYMGGIDSIPSTDPDDIAKADPYAKLALDAVLTGKPVEKSVTRPYGCSVKY